MNFQINKIEDWQLVANYFLENKQHSILLLKGDLGAGKTTFCQFLLKSMGSTDDVSSPTYSIVNEYHEPNGLVYHFDLYRLKSKEEVHDMGMDEYLESGCLCIIEWPEVFISELRYYNFHTIEIQRIDDQRIVYFL